MKNNPINVKINKILPLALKPIEQKKPKEKSKNKTNMKIIEQSQINKFTSKFKSLTLNLNMLTKEIKQ